MNIAVASGKGGTGKTTVSVALAQAFDKSVSLLDCDVEEPNSAFFLSPAVRDTRPVTMAVPEVDTDACTGCGACSDLCAFNAIAVAGNSAIIFPELCHSCGGCARICPHNAITEQPNKIGEIRIGRAGAVQTLEGRLNIGCAMAPPLIRAVKKAAPKQPNLIDAPPGTSCPMITAVNGCDFVVLMTEPTPFGLNDLILAVETVRALELPFGVIINRSDAGDERVVDFCRKENIDILLQIPESRKIAEAYSRGESLIQAEPALTPQLRNVIRRIEQEVSE